MTESALGIIALFAGILISSETREEWRVAEDGSLEYLPPAPEYRLISSEAASDSNLYEVSLSSRSAEMAEFLSSLGYARGSGDTRTIPTKRCLSRKKYTP